MNSKLPSIFYTGKLLADSDDLISDPEYLSQGPMGASRVCCVHLLSSPSWGCPGQLHSPDNPRSVFQGRATSGKLENTPSRVLHVALLSHVKLLLVCVGLVPGSSPALVDWNTREIGRKAVVRWRVLG